MLLILGFTPIVASPREKQPRVCVCVCVCVCVYVCVYVCDIHSSMMSLTLKYSDWNVRVLGHEIVDYVEAGYIPSLSNTYQNLILYVWRNGVWDSVMGVW